MLKSAYKILPNFKLVIEYHQGTLTYPAYVSIKRKILNEPDFKPNYNHLICFREIDFKVTTSEIEEFIAFMHKNSAKLGTRKVAFITDTPKQVVSTTIYKNNISKGNTVEIFSSISGAMKWFNYTAKAAHKIDKELTLLKKAI